MITKLIKNIVSKLFRLKIIVYRKYLSTNYPKCVGRLNAPVVFSGAGTINIDSTVRFGWKEGTQFFYEKYSIIDARGRSALVSIKKNTIFAHPIFLGCNNSSILIGENCHIGANFICLDSDFHGERVKDRDNEKSIINKPVKIGNNVFCGKNVTILKGVTVGDGSIIGSGSVVTKDVAPSTIVAGNPAKFIRYVKE